MENFDVPMLMNSLPLIMNIGKWLGISLGLLYIVAAFGISMLAARLRHPHAWIAWIPVANLYLLCRLAKVSPLFILFAIVPVLNLFILAYLGTCIAPRVGKSAVLGAILGFPILGAFIPLLLATGNNIEPLPEGAKAPSTSPIVYALINAGVAAGLIILAGVGIKMANKMTERVTPTAEQAAATLPKRMAGTLTEFPIDTNTDDPARPVNVMTVGFASGNAAESVSPVGLQSSQLPPWIDPSSLPTMAESAMSADYHSDKSSAQVSVVTLAMRDNATSTLTPPSQTALNELGQNTKVSGVELQSASGVKYQGYHVSTPTSSYYALQQAENQTAIIISANDAAGVEIAERLASNIGNGNGLLEFEQYRNSFGQMPSTPTGSSMAFLKSFTEDDIALMVRQFDQGLNQARAEGEVDPQIASLIDMARAIVPSNVSVAYYTTSSPQKLYGAAVAGYSSSTISWTALQTLGVLQSVIPGQIPAEIAADLPFDYTLNPIQVGEASGYIFDAKSKESTNAEFPVHGGVILLRQGASIVLLGEAGSTSEALLSWAENYVSGN